MRDPVDLGLPTNDLTDHVLAFNEPTAAVAVQLWHVRDECRWGRVYLRTHPSERYHLIGEPTDTCSDRSLISSTGPYLFFLRDTGALTSRGWAFDGASIVRVSLPSRQCHYFSLTQGSPRRLVSRLLHAAQDGITLVASVAVEVNGRQEYSIARMDLQNWSLVPLVPLPALFV